MTVRELIEELQKYNPELPVLISKDEEGNGFEYFSGIGMGWHAEDYGGQLEFTSYPEEIEELQEENTNEFKPCICLWP